MLSHYQQRQCCWLAPSSTQRPSGTTPERRPHHWHGHTAHLGTQCEMMSRRCVLQTWVSRKGNQDYITFVHLSVRVCGEQHGFTQRYCVVMKELGVVFLPPWVFHHQHLCSSCVKLIGQTSAAGEGPNNHFCGSEEAICPRQIKAHPRPTLPTLLFPFSPLSSHELIFR